ncbi:DUF302 domain-containing protein [Motilimonas pumila]|uniref:DUF302 domain-containing protein n=1 Tax=Motilimonas pumila TaxID=2303987 RepID=A0A418YBJ3_9GAMM|nr:DUF302 domain-containing protein [Motilimonas pumila]RJG41858.1 DUF302 domain-containing protein [Motilimonas pumila]
MKLTRLLTILTLFLSQMAFADNGLIKVYSQFDAATTAERLEAALTAKGMTIFTRVPHSESAKKVGFPLNSSELFIFGNPKVGSPLMVCNIETGIDLPHKALIYQDNKGLVWLAYNDPDYIAKRHNVSGCEKPIAKMKQALAAFAKHATKAQ